MFEAMVMVCVEAAGGPCREQLLPGYDAETLAVCEAALAERPPEMARGSDPFCKETGAQLSVDEIAPGVFVHVGRIEEPEARNAGDVANLGFVIGSMGVAVIDTGSARWIGEGLWRSIRARTEVPVTHVILTHMHPDHVFGTSVFEEAGAEIVAHEALPRALSDRAGNYMRSFQTGIGEEAFLGTTAPEATVTVSDVLTIELGDRALEVTAWPVAHTGGDLSVHDDRTGILFAGDLVFDRHTPSLDGSITGWQAVLRDLAARNFEGVVPGHGAPRLDWPEGAGDTLRYLSVLEADTRAALDAGARLGDAAETIAKGEAGNWELFETYNPRNATVAFTELEWE